jgi:hypothetical protein
LYGRYFSILNGVECGTAHQEHDSAIFPPEVISLDHEDIVFGKT